MHAKEEFSHRLKWLRDEIGVTQEEFAKALGVSRPTISYYEKGERIPDIDTLDRIHDVTGCSIGFLMGYADNMKPAYRNFEACSILTNDALDKLYKNEEYGLILSFFIEHVSFSKLIESISVYSRVDDDSEDFLFLRTDLKSYVKFIAVEVFGAMLEEYQLECRTLKTDFVNAQKIKMEMDAAYANFIRSRLNASKPATAVAREGFDSKACQESPKRNPADLFSQFRRRMEHVDRLYADTTEPSDKNNLSETQKDVRPRI